MDHPEIAKPATSDPPLARSPTPQLSILHLMLWTLCSAIYLTLTRTLLELQDNPLASHVSMQRWLGVIYGGLSGAEFAGAIVLVYSRIRHPSSMRLQPGHWLLLIEAVSTTLYLALIFVTIKMGNVGHSSVLRVYFFNSLFSGVGNALAGYRCESRRWKLAFCVMAVLNALDSVAFLLMHSFNINQLGRLLLSVAVTVIAMYDLSGQKSRDWLHWTGVATYVASAGPILIWMIWIHFYR